MAVLGMSTSRIDPFEVLSMLRNAGRGLPGGLQEHREFAKRVRVHNGRRGHRHDAARRRVEHPERNLDRPRIQVRRQTTANDGLA
jgi:hypothetical protein